MAWWPVTVRRGHPTRHRNARVEPAGSERGRAPRGLDATRPPRLSPLDRREPRELTPAKNRADDFSHLSRPQISEWRRRRRWRVWTRRRWRRKSPPCSSRGAGEERRRVYDNNPADADRTRPPAPREKKPDFAVFVHVLSFPYTSTTVRPLRARLRARLRRKRAPLTTRPFSGRRRTRAPRPSPPQTPP